MQHLDLIVTSDTAIAHLAGALGGRCGWRWAWTPTGAGAWTSPIRPWYPTMRLFRQKHFTTGQPSSPKWRRCVGWVEERSDEGPPMGLRP